MYRLVKLYAGDLNNAFIKDAGKVRAASDVPLVRWFDFVRNMPYRIDPKPREIVARPAYILKYGSAMGADCKKKSILLGSWLRLNHIPFRFVAASRRPDKKVHHVFPQGLIGDRWVNLDATYKNNNIDMKRHDTKQEVLRS